jgi:hypothetical protein
MFDGRFWLSTTQSGAGLTFRILQSAHWGRAELLPLFRLAVNEKLRNPDRGGFFSAEFERVSGTASSTRYKQSSPKGKNLNRDAFAVGP